MMKKRSIPLMIVFAIITCGIYNLFWMVMARSEFAAVSGRKDISPGLELFLCIICFPYYYYWIYKFSCDITKFQAERNMPVQDRSILNVILVLFGLGLISELIIQDQLNDLM